MARLIVTALSEDSTAAPGNTNFNMIVVSVTDSNGAPYPNLTATNFQAHALMFGTGGDDVRIFDVTNTVMPGVYFVKVSPKTGTTWKAGVYIFGVAVAAGAARGQVLASVQMD